jgi:hypothetical protein
MRCRNCEEPIDVLDLCEICEMKERVIEPVEVMMCKRGHFMTKGAGKTPQRLAVQRVPAQTASRLQGKGQGGKALEGGTLVIQAIALVLDFAPPHWSIEHAHGRRRLGRLRQHGQRPRMALGRQPRTPLGHLDQAGAEMPAPDRARRLDRTPTRYAQGGDNLVDMAQAHTSGG